MTQVEISALRKTFGGVAAVDSISLAIGDGEFVSLLGPSGCGKTTSLRLIAGFEQPDEGEILIGGKDAAGAPPYKRDVNTVFQQYALFPHMSVLDNVAYGLKQRKVGKPERYARAREALELVRMTGRERNRPTMLITRIRSLTPGTPGRKQQIPRTMRSMLTPAWDASYSARMMAGSTSAFILATMLAGRPSRACSASRRIMAMKRSRILRGATISLRYCGGAAKPVSTLKRSVRSAPRLGLVVKIPKSV